MNADELVARAAAMRETLRARQAECEARGRLPEETNQEYVDAGFYRVLQPRRFGGYELGLETFLRIAIELSRGCPSSGRVCALTAGHAHTVTMWPEQGQVELFGDGDFRCPFSNLGKATALVDTAESALMQVAATWTAQAVEAVNGTSITDEMQRRLLLICQQIVELSTEAVDIVFRTAGTSASRKGEPIERCFRDVNMIRTHVSMQFERTWENVGQMRLGLPPRSCF